MTDLPRPGLCARCGEVLPQPPPEGGESACTSCGLGFSTSRVLFAERAGADDAAVAQERAQIEARLARDRREAVARCRFPVYGLDASWAGRRWIGGWSESNAVLDSVELAHGDAWEDAAPLVRVDTQHDPYGGAGEAARGLAHGLYHETGVHNDTIKAAFDDPGWRDTWERTTIAVDGAPVTFASLQVDAHTIAVGEVGDAVLAIEARHVDLGTIGLVVVNDLGTYLSDSGGPR